MAEYFYYRSFLYNGKLKKLTYANGLSEEYEYNTLELLESVCYNTDDGEVLAYSYEYSNDGTLIYFENHLTGEITEYSYTTGGKLDSVVTGNKSDWETKYSDTYGYNDKGEISYYYNYVSYNCLGIPQLKTVRNNYTYDNDGKIISLQIQTAGIADRTITNTYDSYNRLISKTNDLSDSEHENAEPAFNSTVNYTYTETSTNTSSQVSSYTSTVNGSTLTYTYTYDDNGNIVRIEYSTGPVIRYEYDNLGQLIREDNGYRGHTNTYIYDNAGNIIVANTYNFIPEGEDIANHSPRAIQTFGYSNGAWGDMLTSQRVDIIANGQTTTTVGEITYDELGNPENYYNGTHYTFTWRGRQMTSLTKDGVTYYFEYDNEGHRVKKTVGDKVTNYYYSGDMLVAELCNGEWTMYLYDGMGNPIGYQCGKYVYWYERNLQNDVVAVYNSEDKKIIAYTYDSFGNAYENEIVPSTIAGTNPFRYRGYYYDEEIGLYYLGTRYYDSATGRFLSPDTTAVLTATPMALTDKNLYAYCDNNPITRVDHGGEFWHIVGGALLGIGSQLFSDLVTSAIDGELSFSHWSNYVGAAAGGAVAAAIPMGPVLSDAVGTAVSSIVSPVAYNIESAFMGRDEKYSFEEIAYNTINNTVISATSSFVFSESNLSKKNSSKKHKHLKISLNDFARGLGIATLDGIKNSKINPSINTHTWDSPTVGRYYILR